jgi:hypothetical protein
MRYWVYAILFQGQITRQSLECLRLAAGATMKYIMYEHIALSTKVIFAILTPIAIERTHSFTYVRRRRSLKRQCTRVTIRV